MERNCLFNINPEDDGMLRNPWLNVKIKNTLRFKGRVPKS
jgi:hypothetical protein